jgi:hypothetical protein
MNNAHERAVERITFEELACNLADVLYERTFGSSLDDLPDNDLEPWLALAETTLRRIGIKGDCLVAPDDAVLEQIAKS